MAENELEPPKRINESDFRGVLSLIVISGFLIFGVLGFLYGSDGQFSLDDFMTSLSPMVTLILGFYFGVQAVKSSSRQHVEQQQDVIQNLLHYQKTLIELAVRMKAEDLLKNAFDEPQDGEM